MPLSVSLRVAEDTVVRDLSAFREDVDRLVERAIDRGTREILLDIRSRMPRQSGELMGSYRRVALPKLGLVGSELVRARFAEFGTKHQVGNRIVESALHRQIAKLQRSIEQEMARAAR